MRKFVTINETLQSIKSKFESGFDKVKSEIIEKNGVGEHNVSMGFTSMPVEFLEDENLITAHDNLEENVIYAVSEYFDFETDVYLSDGCVIISKNGVE